MAGSPAHRRPVRRAVAFVVLVALVAGALAASVAIYGASRSSLTAAPYHYNLAAWETRNVTTKWLYGVRQLIHGHPNDAEQNATLSRFFALTREIDRLESQTSDARQRGAEPDARASEALAGDVEEREGLKNQVEATIEGRLTQVIKDQGLMRSVPLIHDVVWPPVDFAFSTSPRTLALSPRDRIKLTSTTLLRGDLSLAQVEQIEAEAQGRPNVSAIAFPTSGLSAYPPIVDYDDDYQSALTTIAHEWTHNYLFFRPLGFNYYASNDTRTMNETVANTVGTELAAAVMARWPLTTPATPPQPATTPAQRPAVNINTELRDLRGQVDALLAAGKVSDAESLMEQKRQDLASRGYRIRKINQAYFAFTNLYAGATGNAGAVSPIGPKIDELRKRSPSLREFVRVISGLTSSDGLDRALAQLTQTP